MNRAGRVPFPLATEDQLASSLAMKVSRIENAKIGILVKRVHRDLDPVLTAVSVLSVIAAAKSSLPARGSRRVGMAAPFGIKLAVILVKDWEVGRIETGFAWKKLLSRVVRGLV